MTRSFPSDKEGGCGTRQREQHVSRLRNPPCHLQGLKHRWSAAQAPRAAFPAPTPSLVPRPSLQRTHLPHLLLVISDFLANALKRDTGEDGRPVPDPQRTIVRVPCCLPSPILAPPRLPQGVTSQPRSDPAKGVSPEEGGVGLSPSAPEQSSQGSNPQGLGSQTMAEPPELGRTSGGPPGRFSSPELPFAGHLRVNSERRRVEPWELRLITQGAGVSSDQAHESQLLNSLEFSKPVAVTLEA